MSFQENLKYYRERAGYKTAKEFVKEIGIPYNTYVGYEVRGREPKFNTLCQIADLLNVSTDELLGRKNNILGNKEDDQLKKLISDILSEYDIDKIIKFHKIPVPIPEEYLTKDSLVFDIVYKDMVAAIPKITLLKYINQINAFFKNLSTQLIFIYLISYLSLDKLEDKKDSQAIIIDCLRHPNELRNARNESFQDKELKEWISIFKHDLKALRYEQKAITALNKRKDYMLSSLNEDLNAFIKHILGDIPKEITSWHKLQNPPDEDLFK